MADHSKPLVTSTYTNFVTELDGRFDDLALGLDPATTTPTNLPTGAIRWNSASSKWEKWSGTAWADLSASYNINLSGPLTLTANSSSDALRITQTGAGNALVVEDSANPDSSPFVIDASGRVCIGATSTTYNIEAVGYSFAPTWATTTHVNNQNGSYFRFGKARGGTATPSIVQDADNLGNIRFLGYDSVDFILAARIDAAVDGTPGTNDMPGRLVFSTTADGDSSPTERMRIDSAGRFYLGTTAPSAAGIKNYWNPTGSTTAYGQINGGTIQSGVTGTAFNFYSFPSTVAESFTLANLHHFSATQGTVGASSAITNQYGFYANSALTGATNNYGFYSNIASGTGRWNFYAAGTAANYFAGNTGFNKTDPSYIIDINVGSSTDRAVNIYNSDSTLSDGENIHSILFTQNDASYPNATHAWIKTYAVGSTGDTAMAFATGGSGTATERMRIDSAGRVGIGSSGTTAGYALRVGLDLSDATSFSIAARSVIQSGSTTHNSIVSWPATAASSFTLSTLIHLRAFQGTIGAGSTITNQYGFYSDSNLTGATNNYGFYSNIASGTGRWNFYAAGTADNYFAGKVLFGTTIARVFDSGTSTFTPTLQQEGTDAGTSSLSLTRNSASPNAAALVFGKSRSASLGGVTVVQSGDTLGSILFEGTDGTNLIEAAGVYAEVDGTPGTNDMPGRLVFSTTADGASSPTERLCIDSAGRCDMQSSFNQEASGTASSISGTTLTVGGTVTGTFAVGQRIWGSNVDPNTFITALGTGTGGAGTYTVSNSQTVSSTAIYAAGGGINVFRFTDTDSSATGNSPMGVIEWYGSDASTPGAGVKAYIAGISESTTPDAALIFGTADNVASTQAKERMRIDSSGNLLVGKTANAIGTSGIIIQPAAEGAGTGANIQWNKTSTGSFFAAQYVHATTIVGSITYSNTATAYNTSSDYRLKENIQPMQNALAVVQQLNPVTYTWKADGSDGQGFIAHELQAVVPDCVTGEKDDVDAEGNPVYQGIDTSFLVATLTKAIQELKAELDATKAEVAALKGIK